MRPQENPAAGDIVQRPAEEPAARARGDPDPMLSLLRSAFDASDDGLLLIDGEGRLAAFNPRFAELWGASTALGADALTKLAAAQLEDGAQLLRALRSPGALAGERLVRCREGRVIQRSARALASGWLWTFRDVTQRVRVEEALRAEEDRYRELYNKTPVMMHSIDRQGRLVSVSDAWLRTLGYTRDEVLGRKSVDFLTPESRRHAIEVVLPRYFRTGACDEVPYQLRTKSGEIVDVLLSAIAERDADGSHKRSLAVLVDVTRRRQVEAERDRLLVRERGARESGQSALALLDTLFRTAPVGLAFLDRDLRYLRVNEMLARSFHGGSPEASIGRNVWDAVPDLAPTVAPILLRVLHTGQPITNVDVTGEVPAAPGDTRSVLVSYYPVRGEAGGVLGVGVVAVDITEQKRAAELQARLYTEAQEAVRVRDDFFTIASHELRTPMTPLMIHLQMLDRAVRAGEPVDVATVQKAMRQLAKLTSLVNDLLDASRVRVGRLTLHRTAVRLGATVENVIASARTASPHHTLELDDAELIVTGDEQRLAQVVSNLVENAVKYSAAGTTVRVSLRRRDGEALLSVADEGIGIPPEELPKLFDRFFRARNAPVSHYGGLGLGLYICRDIVERHGGTIEAESELGVGSIFRVALPLAAARRSA